MKLLVSFCLLFAGSTLVSSSFAGADLQREKRMASEIEDAIIDGDPVEIEANGHSFFSIYTETDAEAVKGSVLIVHGRGFHPDWSTVIQPLRVGLAESGWNTLSIQMPVLEKSAKYNEYVDIFGEAIPRIEAALKYLKENSEGKIVVVAHSCGSHMVQHWVHKAGESAIRQIDGYVGIGMGATDYKQPMVEPFALDKMTMPLMDIYAENDYPAVIRMAPERAAMMKKSGNAKSAQVVIPGAEHYYSENPDLLLEQVAAWLDTL